MVEANILFGCYQLDNIIKFMSAQSDYNSVYFKVTQN